MTASAPPRANKSRTPSGEKIPDGARAMSSAEFDLIRRGLFLTDTALADWFGVRVRNIQHMCSGRVDRRIPPGIAQALRDLDVAVGALAWDTVDTVELDPDTALVTYAHDADLAALEPRYAHLGASGHSAAMARALIHLGELGIGLAGVARMDRDRYADWLDERGEAHAGTASVRAWGAAVIAAQASSAARALAEPGAQAE